MANPCANMCHRRRGRPTVPGEKRNQLTIPVIGCSRNGRVRLPSLLALLLACAGAAPAQKKTVLTPPPLPAPPLVSTTVQTVSPFTLLGFLQSATLNTPADKASGGTMVVNGHTITVSADTTVYLPGSTLRWAELFSLAPAPWGPTQTGLALSDLPKPLTTYEVLVQGNRTINAGRDQYNAGLIFLSQQSLNTGQGFINFIDYSAGELRVGGIANDPTSGARVRLNDPIGRYGRAMSPDVRFTIDENNPTVRSATGYPMCIPRVNVAAASPAHPVADDPLCPQVNRPKDPSTGAFLNLFTMPPPPCSYFAPLPSGTPSVAPPFCTLNPQPGKPDATQQMPFEIGDYVTFRGTLVPNTTTPACVAATGAPPDPACQYISAWSVIANIGAFTAPGTMPAYVAIDVTLMGTGGVPTRGLPQEATSTVKVEGFTTDSTEPLDIYGVDIDPCLGTTSDRYWGTEPVQQIGKLGRFRFLPVGGAFTPPVREVRAVSQTLSQGAIPATINASATFANGLIAGQYQSPISVFIFPESAEIGTRIALNFQDFPFLAEDVGGSLGPGRGCSASLTPSAVSFSDQEVGTVSAAQTVTLTNTGAGTLKLGNISISSSFSQVNNCGTQLAKGASCTLSVRFQPASSVPQTGTLQVNDTATASPQTVSLVGTPALTRIASLTPSALSFSDQLLGTASASQNVTLTNTGTGAFNLSSVSISPEYSQTNDCGTQLAPGASCTFAVTFMPTTPGSKSGVLQISDNAAISPQTVSLIGTVVLGPIASWARTALAFGDQAPGTASTPQTVLFSNTGSAGLNIHNVSLTAGYWQTNDCPPQLQAGAKCTFSVKFLPGAVGDQPGILSIADNAGGSPHNVSLTASSSDFSLIMDAGAPMLASVFAGETALYKLRISGTSRASGTVSLACSGLPKGAQCNFSPATITLHGTQTQSITVLISTPETLALNAAHNSKRPMSFPYAISLFGGVVAAVFTRRGRRQFALGLIVFCALLLNACGGGGWTNEPAPGTRFIVTATASNGAVHSVQLRLLVKPRTSPKRSPLSAE